MTVSFYDSGYTRWISDRVSRLTSTTIVFVDDEVSGSQLSGGDEGREIRYV